MEGQQISGSARRATRMASPPRVEFRSSTTAMLFQSGTGWLTLAAIAIVFGGGAWLGYWWQTLAGIAVATVPLLVWQYLKYRTSVYALDSERLFMLRGILMRTEEEIELYRIKDAKVNFSIIQQLFSNGTIAITSSDVTGTLAGQQTGGARNMILVPHVVDARRIREEIRNRVEAARERRGVREFDIG